MYHVYICEGTVKEVFRFVLQKQTKAAQDFLANEMGQMVNRASRDKIPINLTKDEIQSYIKRFQIIDKDRKGFVSINDIRRSLKVVLKTLRTTLSFYRADLKL